MAGWCGYCGGEKLKIFNMAIFKKNGIFYFFGALLLVAILIWVWAIRLETHRGMLFVDIFDIGQGDSIFIEAPNGNQVLVDGGPSSAVLSKLGRVMPLWDRSIDVLLLTHPHADHVDGLLEVLKRYDIGMVIESGVNHSIPEYETWHALLREKHVPVMIAHEGERLVLDSNITLDILMPLAGEDFKGKTVKNVHEGNVASRLRYGNEAILLTGDMESRLEYQLIESGEDIRAQILKVGHHGSKTSTSEVLLTAVQPETAVISVGARNRYGHPAQVVLDRLAQFGVRTFRTDRDGDIAIIMSSTTYQIFSRPF